MRGLRVLAIRAEPPTVALGEGTTLDALVVTPDDAPVTLRWELCAYTLSGDEKRACGPGGLLASGDGDTFDVVFTEEMAAVLAPLCDRSGVLAGTIPDGAALPSCSEAGVQATARLIVTGEDGEELVAIGGLLMRTKTAGPADTNPRILGLEGAPAGVTPGEELTLECMVDPESVDTLKLPDEDEPRDEELEYAWYVAGGSMQGGGGGRNPFGGDNDTPPEQAIPVADDDAERLTVWVVVSDERDGVAWARVDVPVVR